MLAIQRLDTKFDTDKNTFAQRVFAYMFTNKFIFISGWQVQYNHDPYEILRERGIILTEEIKHRIRGSEAAMWSEQAC